MKLYEFTTTEHNGEQEYSHYHLVYAVTLAQAKEKAKEYCRTWYNDEDVKQRDGECTWDFFNGEIVLTLDEIKQCTQVVWKESRFLDALIGGRPEENRLSDIKKDLAKYLADYIEQEKVCVARHYGEGAQRNRNITDIIEQALDAFESTQEKVVTEGGE